MTDFILARDVAKLTGFTSDTAFLQARARLERDAGFPQPMPTCLRPLKWRASAIEAWIESQGQSATVAAQLRHLGPNVYLLAEARRA